MSVPYNYKFGGKELQETGFYDFGARMLMPDLGRWFNIDSLAELRPDLTPFRYAFNNPISFTDPNGMYEGGGGDWDADNDVPEQRTFNFHLGFNGPTSDTSNGDLINSLSFSWDFSVKHGGGDANHGSDFMADMGNENSSDMGQNNQGSQLEQGCCPDPKPGQEIWDSVMHNMLDGFANFGDALNLTIDWFTGAGDSKRIITTERVVNSLKDAPAVNRARDFWYAKADRLNSSKVIVTNYAGKFGLKGATSSGASPFKQLIGTMNINIYSDGENLTFEIWNKTSFKSFFYQAPVPSWNRSTMPIMGNMEQVYRWKEKIYR